MRRAIVLVVAALLVAAGVSAQSQYQSAAPAKKQPRPLDPADVATLTGRSMPQQQAARPRPGSPAQPADVDALTGRSNGQTEARPAPKRGQPLDWNDVDILSGKNQSSTYSPATPYVTVPMGAGWPNDSAYQSRIRFRSDCGLFAPTLCGVTRRSPLFFHRPRPHPSFFFFTGGTRSASLFLFVP
jgi:hypothetical protein